MKNQSTIKVRSRTKELLDEMSERFGLPVAQIVDIMAKMAKKAEESGTPLSIYPMDDGKKSSTTSGVSPPPKPDPLHALPIHAETRARSKVTRAADRVMQEDA